jgi:WD40 repeat protein
MKNRYPGIQPFTANDQALFCGRDREIEALSNLIVLNRVIVLFGKSGTGKSSLLQAGVTPRLNNWYLQPLYIRFKNRAIDPEKQVYQFLNDGNYLPQSPPNLTLWEYFKLFDYSYAGDDYVPVVIFDQFEELFTLYSPLQRQAFIAQLADLINGRVPDSVQQQINQDIAGNPQLSLDEIAQREASPKVKILLSIRSDSLYLLDQLSNAIPAILRCRYELLPLGINAAQRAIEYPAQLENSQLHCPPFHYSKAALDNILSTLAATQQNAGQTPSPNHENTEIEAFQLQLLCQHIETLVLNQQAPTQAPFYTVQPELYGGTAGIGEILSDFYQNVLLKIDAQNPNYTPNKQPLRQTVQLMIEEDLLNQGKRIMHAQDYLCEKHGISPDILAQLSDLRLLRKENYKQTNYYEISHDTLVKPIQELHAQRKNEERKQSEIAEKIRLQAEKEAAQRELAKERRRKSVLGSLLLLSLCALGAALFAWRYSQQKEREAKANYYASQALHLQNNTTQAIQLADTACQLQQNPLALSSFWQSAYSRPWQWHDTLYYPPLYTQYDIAQSALQGIGALSGFESTWTIAPNGKKIAYIEQNQVIIKNTTTQQTQIIDLQSIEQLPKTSHTINTRQIGLLKLDHSGNYLAITQDSTAYIYDTRQNKAVYALKQSQLIVNIAFSPNSAYIMTDVGDGFQHLWQSSNGAKIDSFANNSVYNNYQSPLQQVHFSPDSRYLLILRNNDTLQAYHLPTRQQFVVATRPQARAALSKTPNNNAGKPKTLLMHRFAFSPNGEQIAVAWTDSIGKGEAAQQTLIAIYHTNGGMISRLALPNQGNAATAMTFLDNQIIATGNQLGEVQCWSAAKGNLLHQWKACQNAIVDLSVADSGRYLLVTPSEITANNIENNTQKINPNSHSDNCIYYEKYAAIWEKQGDKPTYQHLITLFTNDEYTHKAYFANNEQIVSIFNDNKVRLWQLNSNAMRLAQQPNMNLLNSAWLPQQKQLICLAQNGKNYVYDQYGKASNSDLPIWAKPTLNYFAFADPYILTQTQQHPPNKIQLQYWHTNSTKPLSEWTVDGKYLLMPLTLSPNGNYALCYNSQAQLSFWHTPNATLIAQPKLPNGTLTAIAIARQPENSFGVLIEKSAMTFDLCLYKAEQLQYCKTLTLPAATNHAMTIVSNPKQAARFAIAADNDIYLYDQNIAPITRLTGHRSHITHLATSPNEQLLVSCANDGSIKIWDITSRICLHTFGGHTQAVKYARFSADGHFLNSVGNDGKSFIWQLLPPNAK